jgi:hypothetical protein
MLALTGRTEPEALPHRVSYRARIQPCVRERRAATRYKADLRSRCEPLAFRKEQSWDGTLHDISTTGIRLVLPRRFEVGTHLLMELNTRSEKLKSTYVVRIVRVQKGEADSWDMGCTFLKPLTPAELTVLLGPQ